jgi:hypothetical protein
MLCVMDANNVLVLKDSMAPNRIFNVELKVMEHRCHAIGASRE